MLTKIAEYFIFAVSAVAMFALPILIVSVMVITGETL
jgi:hypothetical protein